MTWWAAQVASEKEYETRREIVSSGRLSEEDVLIPRMNVFTMAHDEKVEKKSEAILPGYILLNLGRGGMLAGIESMSNFINILGLVTPEEMENLKELESPLEDTKELNTEDKIMVVSGPFAGVKGSITSKIDNSKYSCLLVFHGNEIETDLDSKIIERIS